MSFPLLRFVALIVCPLVPTPLARAETLPLPQSLIGTATDQGEAVLPVEVIKKMGITLDQLGGLLAIQPVTVSVHHAADSSMEAFRNQVRDALAASGQFVIVNYLRKAIGQERGGHISPLAAFDAKSDRFLILDVARCKYPPVWAKTTELFVAMNTQDSDNDNRTRGYVLVARK